MEHLFALSSHVISVQALLFVSAKSMFVADQACRYGFSAAIWMLQREGANASAGRCMSIQGFFRIMMVDLEAESSQRTVPERLLVICQQGSR